MWLPRLGLKRQERRKGGILPVISYPLKNKSEIMSDFDFFAFLY